MLVSAFNAQIAKGFHSPKDTQYVSTNAAAVRKVRHTESRKALFYVNCSPTRSQYVLEG